VVASVIATLIAGSEAPDCSGLGLALVMQPTTSIFKSVHFSPKASLLTAA
jgi:hypothetical protein